MRILDFGQCALATPVGGAVGVGYARHDDQPYPRRGRPRGHRAFLDELGDMALQMQLKRLQAVEEKCCRRLGEVSDGAAGLDRPAGLAGWRGRSPIG